MALMFSRVARNFIKNGYYPTDEVTIERILNALSTEADYIRVLDPCCGEGTALAEIKHHFAVAGDVGIEAFGVELDQERATHARQLLDQVIHSDIENTIIAKQSVGLLFLNPPYGDRFQNKDSDEMLDRKRFETMFIERTMPSLQEGGVLVLIVPYYIVNDALINVIAGFCEQVQVFLGPVQTYKQCVIFGKKRTSLGLRRNQQVLDVLTHFSQDPLCCPELPEVWYGEQLMVPAAKGVEGQLMRAVRIDGEQLSIEVMRLHQKTLWPRLMNHFRQTLSHHRRPLRALSKWHLALALASGQIDGVIQNHDGTQVMLIKGSTHKTKVIEMVAEVDSDDEVIQVTKSTDRFVPVIKAIDFSDNDNLGRIVTIG